MVQGVDAVGADKECVSGGFPLDGYWTICSGTSHKNNNVMSEKEREKNQGGNDKILMSCQSIGINGIR